MDDNSSPSNKCFSKAFGESLNRNYVNGDPPAVLVASNALKFSLWVWRGNPMCGHCNDMIATQCVCLSDGDDYNVVQGIVNR